MTDSATYRADYARNVAASAGAATPGLVDAFAAVPRERFLRPGPWLVAGEAEVGKPPRQTPDADPRHVYDNVSVAIDPGRQLFNGSPVVLARLIEALKLRPGARVLHVGAGLGYYSAIIGHIVGPAGAVVAVEVDQALAADARSNVADMPWIEVREDAVTDVGSVDAILVNAGVTHPQEAWLDALTPGGRLVLPLTMAMPAMGSSLGKGVVVAIERTGAKAFSAEVLSFVAIYSAIGLRDEAIGALLGQALRRTSFPNLTALRRDAHDSTPGCWLHTDRCCLSMEPVPDR